MGGLTGAQQRLLQSIEAMLPEAVDDFLFNRYLDICHEGESSSIFQNHFEKLLVDKGLLKKFEDFLASRVAENEKVKAENKIKKLQQEKPVSTARDGVITPMSETKHIVALNAKELLALDIPPLEWLVKGLLPADGVAVLSAPPKYYKSFLCLQLCIAVCTGSEFLAHETVRAGAIYFDLESNKRRPRDRLKSMLKETPAPENLYIVTLEDEPGTLDDGFIAVMQDQVNQHPDIRLFVIDVFQRIRQAAKKGQNAYTFDFESMKPLSEFAARNRVCCLIVHHNKKEFDQSDVFNSMSGSTGLLGFADVALMLTRKNRNSQNTVLHCTGRDIASEEFAIEFDKSSMKWRYKGMAEEVETSKELDDFSHDPTMRTLLKAIEINGGAWEGTTSDLIKESEYHGHKIFSDKRSVGRVISKYADFLKREHGITYTYSLKGKARQRVYSFHKDDKSTGQQVTLGDWMDGE